MQMAAKRNGGSRQNPAYRPSGIFFIFGVSIPKVWAQAQALVAGFRMILRIPCTLGLRTKVVRAGS